MSGSGDYISREETLERLCKDVCNVSDCQCDEARCEEWFVIHNIPAADVVPLDYHERCLQIEVEKRLALELQMPRWIPAAERLPVSGVPVLICGDGNVVEQGFFDDEFGYWYDSRGYRTFVHHWMPMLQGPPKEK